MSLSSKTLAILAVTVGAASLIAYAVSAHLMIRSYRSMQEAHTRMNVRRALRTLSTDIDRLSTLTGDWGRWDETYRFVKDRNPKYIQNNFTKTTFAELRVDQIVYIDTADRVVYAAGYDLSKGKPIPPSNAWSQQIIEDLHTASQPASRMTEVSGIIMLKNKPAIMAAYPILTSRGTGPSRGTIAMIRHLDSTLVRQLAEAAHLDIALLDLKDHTVPESLRHASTGKQTPTVVRLIDDKRSIGYMLLRDTRGRPAAILRTVVPARLLRQSAASVRWLLISMLSVGVMFTLVSVLLVKKLVLSRLVRISNGIEKVGRTGDLSTRLQVEGTDELSNVAATVNWMLKSLESAHDELESKVEERTRELAAARESLQAAYDREHHIALILQHALVEDIHVAEPEYELIARYQPALAEAEVGGDFYDVFPVSDCRKAVVIGDVAGKGLSAAIYTAMVKYMLRGFAHENPQPGDALTRLNAAVCDYTPEDTFITLFFGLLDPKAGTLEYASAGHDCPLLYHGATGEISQLASTGTVIGTLEGASYGCREVEVRPGDTLILYTDGITDARDGGSALGAEGLTEVVRASGEADAHTILDAAFSAACEAANCNWPDDAAAMVIKTNEKWCSAG
jgi:serine phosphatase RsbU (regulator of sigma subunit)/sensor domain CHASE-containing protein